jgi:multiple sugar transport system substrate-binding protein
MKRKILLVVLLLCSFCILGGCQKEDNHGLDTDNPTQVTIWNYYNGAQAVAFDELVTEFNETEGKEKGIVVLSESKGSIDDLVSDVQDSIDNKVGAKEMPNMVQCYLDTAVNWDKDDIFVNLDDYVSEDIKSEYIDAYIEDGSFGEDNAWQLFPIAKSTEVLMLNKTDWEPFAQACGYTEDDLKTWESLAKVAESYYDWSGGKSFFGRDAFANYMLVGSAQLGKEIFQVEGDEATLQFDETIMKKLWDNYYVPYVKGYYLHEGRYRSDDIKLGKIIAMVCSSTSTAYFPTEVTNDKETYAIEPLVLPLPNFEGTQSYAVEQGANIGVIKSSETQEYASVVFLEWITQTEQNLKFSVESSYLPVKKEANTEEAYNDFIQKNEIEVDSIVNDTFQVALPQIESSTMYNEKGFTNAYDARNVVESTMISLAQQDRSDILTQISKGKTEEEAVAPYLTEEYFQKWYDDTKQQLSQYCK